MGVFPDAEECERPVDGDRDQRKKQPEARELFGVIDVTPERVDREAEEQAEIDTEAARADGKLLAGDMERAVGYLVAEEAEEIIER